MKSTDNVGITFVNRVLNRGILNGVFNITLAAHNLEPDEKGEKIDLATVIVARLRMDLACAREIRDTIDEFLKSLDAPPVPGNGVAHEGTSDSAAKH